MIKSQVLNRYLDGSYIKYSCGLLFIMLTQTSCVLLCRYNKCFHFFNTDTISEKNNVDVGVNISGELDSLKKNLDKYKKSGMGGEFEDLDIQTLDWVEDNRKVKAFFIYESSL